MHMNTKVFNIAVPIELLKILDQQVKLHFTNRNEYVKRAILAQLKKEGALKDPAKQLSYNELRKENLKNYLAAQKITSAWDDLD